MKNNDTCFCCGAYLINGECPECGYYFPFAFECPFLKGTTCVISRRLCNKGENYTGCKLWQQNAT